MTKRFSLEHSLQADFNVSRETFSRLEAFAALLQRWNARINLISKHSVGQLWERHIVDSIQLWPYLPAQASVLTDFGSGAGFPGMVLAILGFPEVHLIESDKRKAAFLLEASKLAPGRVIVHSQRIEALVPWKSDIITARALASMSDLLTLVAPFFQKTSCAFFLKGGKVREEITEAKKTWRFSERLHPSVTDSTGWVVTLENIELI